MIPIYEQLDVITKYYIQYKELIYIKNTMDVLFIIGLGNLAKLS